MSRITDVCVGTMMILGSLLCQAVVAFVVLGLLFAGVASYLGIQSELWVFVAEAIALLALNLVTYYEFRRRIATHRTLGLGGGFFLLFRGIWRIRHGRETYLQPIESPGFQVQPRN